MLTQTVNGEAALITLHSKEEHVARRGADSTGPRHRIRGQCAFSNTNGVENSVAGQGALYSNTTGSGNIAAGFAGIRITTGSNAGATL
jgi:hypothetical protein